MNRIWFISWNIDYSIWFCYLILLRLIWNQMKPQLHAICSLECSMFRLKNVFQKIHLYDNNNIIDCEKQYCTAWDRVNWVIRWAANKWEEAALIWTMGHMTCEQSAQRMYQHEIGSVGYSDLFNQKIVEVSSVTKSIYFSHLVYFFACHIVFHFSFMFFFHLLHSQNLRLFTIPSYSSKCLSLIP